MTEPSLQGFATIPRHLLHDPAVPWDAKLVYAILSSHVGGNRTAWPSHQRMADHLGVGKSTVKRAVRWLIEQGHVQVVRRPLDNGDFQSNEYRLISGSATESRRDEATPGPDRPQVQTDPRSRQTPGPDRPQGLGPEGPGVGPHGTPNESHRTRVSSERESVRLPANVNALFDRFWAAYPRKVEKAKAMKLFADKVRRSVDPEVIIAGAERYRRDPNREDEFTKHPTTWLNGGCWEDEPLPPRSNGRLAPTPPRRPEQGLTVALPLASGQR